MSGITTKRPRGAATKPTTGHGAEAAGRQAYEDAATGKGTPRALTPMQMFADEVGDMLVRGGNDEEISSLLWAALGSMNRRLWTALESDLDRVEARVRDFTGEAVRRAKVELAQEWQRNWRATPEETIEPASVTARVRAGVIDQMRDAFNNWFIMNGTPEEHHLMLGILVTHMSMNRGRHTSDEMPLTMAMKEQVDGVTREFIRVPPRLIDQVERYVEALLAVEGKAA